MHVLHHFTSLILMLVVFSCLIELHGIHKQASVGFLTLMESLRYCKVTLLNFSPSN